METLHNALERHTRNTSIDFLRGLSILAVMFYHFRPFGVGSWGLYGVSLFFMISGYCMIPSMATSTSLRHFLAKRLARLVPALIVAALVTSILKQVLTTYGYWSFYGVGNYFKAVFCIPMADIPCGFLNLFTPGLGFYDVPDGAYWSLLVEIRFYVVVGALFFLAGLNWLLFSFAIIASFLWILILAWIYLVQHNVEVVFFGILAPYMAYFLVGISAYYFLELGKRKTALVYIVVSIAVLIAQYEVGYYVESIPVTQGSIIAFLVCVILLMAVRRYIDATIIKKLTPIKWIAGVGLISYPLYLLHQDAGSILILVAKSIGVNEVITRLVIVPLTIGFVAWLIHWSVEFRFSHVLRKFFYRFLGVGFVPAQAFYRIVCTNHRTSAK